MLYERIIDPEEENLYKKPRIVNNGRCIKCGKELHDNRIFLCEDCSKLLAEEAKG